MTSVVVLRQFQDYVTPEDGATSQIRRTVPAATSDSDGALASSSSLGDSVLTVNIGIPIVVVLTKVCSGSKHDSVVEAVDSYVLTAVIHMNIVVYWDSIQQKLSFAPERVPYNSWSCLSFKDVFLVTQGLYC